MGFGGRAEIKSMRAGERTPLSKTHMSVCMSGCICYIKPGGTAGVLLYYETDHKLLSLHFICKGQGLFFWLLPPTSQDFINKKKGEHDNGSRDKDPLQNLSGRERDAKGMVQCASRYGKQAGAPPEPGHLKAHDGTGTGSGILRRAGEAGAGQRGPVH